MEVKVLLDTNAYAAWKRGDDRVASLLRQAELIYCSAVVAGELHFGFRHGSNVKKNLDELDAFLRNPFVRFLPVTMDTADRFGRVAASLRRKGSPIPSNDIWIAAHALETGSDLVSFDKHFAHVEGLALAHIPA